MKGPLSRNFATAVIAAIGIMSLSGYATYAAQYEGSVLYQLLPPDGNPLEGIEVLNTSNGIAVGTDANNEVVAWTNPSGIGVSLNMPGFDLVYSQAIAGQYEAGFADNPTTGEVPYLWKDSTSSAINMSPPGMADGAIWGADATQEVGSGSFENGVSGGLLWTGTSPNAVVLGAPAGFIGGVSAYGVGGNEQVGKGNTASGNQHALLWFGSMASVVDLQPTGFTDSEALGTDGTQQVGYGSIQGTPTIDALLWCGSADSVVDLNPTAYTDTQALATNGSEQVGSGQSIADDGNIHALLWSGSADSVVDLNDLLPSDGEWNDGSRADSIDADGNVFGWAYGAYQGVYGLYLIEWSPLPEPINVSFLTLAAVAIVRCPSRRARQH